MRTSTALQPAVHLSPARQPLANTLDRCAVLRKAAQQPANALAAIKAECDARQRELNDLRARKARLEADEARSLSEWAAAGAKGPAPVAGGDELKRLDDEIAAVCAAIDRANQAIEQLQVPLFEARQQVERVEHSLPDLIRGVMLEEHERVLAELREAQTRARRLHSLAIGLQAAAADIGNQARAENRPDAAWRAWLVFAEGLGRALSNTSLGTPLDPNVACSMWRQFTTGLAVDVTTEAPQ